MFLPLWLDIRTVDQPDIDATLAERAEAAMAVDPISDEESGTDDEDPDSDDE